MSNETIHKRPRRLLLHEIVQEVGVNIPINQRIANEQHTRQLSETELASIRKLDSPKAPAR